MVVRSPKGLFIQLSFAKKNQHIMSSLSFFKIQKRVLLVGEFFKLLVCGMAKFFTQGYQNPKRWPPETAINLKFFGSSPEIYFNFEDVCTTFICWSNVYFSGSQFMYLKCVFFVKKSNFFIEREFFRKNNVFSFQM